MIGDTCSQTSSLQRRMQGSAVSDVFFSRENVDAVQDGIRYMVWKRSDQKYVISKQDEVQLHYVMRSIYLQYARNAQENVIEQVRCLNERVLDYCVSTVLREIEAHNFYMNDITKMPVPMERSKNASSAGTKVLIQDTLM